MMPTLSRRCRGGCLLGLFAWGTAWAAPASSPFGPGEQTTYAVQLLGVTAGEAQVTVGWPTLRDGRAVWPLVCVGRTTGVATLYPLNDRFVSYWDPLTGDAVASDLLADENRKRRIERYEYDFVAMEAVTTKQSIGQPARGGRYPIVARTVDLASAAFRLRTLGLEVGQVHELPIFTGGGLYQMKATVVGAERLTTIFGETEVLRVTVNGEFSGKLATRGLMTLFFTADAKQLPVRAEAELALGSIVLEALRYEPGRTSSDAPLPGLSER